MQSAEVALTIFDLPMNIPNFQEPGEYKLEVTVVDLEVTVTDQTNQRIPTEEVAFEVE